MRLAPPMTLPPLLTRTGQLSLNLKLNYFSVRGGIDAAELLKTVAFFPHEHTGSVYRNSGEHERQRRCSILIRR